MDNLIPQWAGIGYEKHYKFLSTNMYSMSHLTVTSLLPRSLSHQVPFLSLTQHPRESPNAGGGRYCGVFSPAVILRGCQCTCWMGSPETEIQFNSATLCL